MKVRQLVENLDMEIEIFGELVLKHAHRGTLHIYLEEDGDQLFDGPATTTADRFQNGIATFLVSLPDETERIVVLYIDHPNEYSYELKPQDGTVWLHLTVQD